jgi:hypothetical protein
MNKDSTSAPNGALTIRVIAMPADANAAGDVFGGWVIAQMDLAAGIRASERARGRVVTAAISVDPRTIGSGAGLAGFIQMTIGAPASQSAGYAQGTWHNTGFWAMACFAILALVSHPARRRMLQQ